MLFSPMPKVPRLSREVVITEKLDGTNASIFIQEMDAESAGKLAVLDGLPYLVRAGSRTRWITPDDDNYGFARWAYDHADELVKLGPGHHFGEWWGNGIQRNYGLAEKRFSLFNVARWYKNGVPHFALRDIEETKSWQLAPECCYVVPVLYRGPMGDASVDVVLDGLRERGSRAAPGFMDPEGIMVYHTAANIWFKKTLKGDAEGKSREANIKKEKPPRPPKDPSTGGRRNAQCPIDFPDRRAAK
jgi:hypothetical protein